MMRTVDVCEAAGIAGNHANKKNENSARRFMSTSLTSRMVDEFCDTCKPHSVRIERSQAGETWTGRPRGNASKWKHSEYFTSRASTMSVRPDQRIPRIVK